MKFLIISCLAFFDIFSGNGCSNRTMIRKIEVDEERIENDQAKIINVVDNFELPVILLLHRRSRTRDFLAYVTNTDYLEFFRQCVARKYEENKDEIDKLAQESDNKYRQAVLAPKVHVLNLRRNRTKRLKTKLPSNLSNLKAN